MLRKMTALVLAVLVALLPAGVLAQTEILVLAAASLTDAMDEIIALYEGTHPDVKVTASYDGSGKLLLQLEQGAPADIFISAAQKQMDTAQAEGLILEDTRFDLLENKVVLIVPEGKEAPASFEDIAQAGLIALGEPEAVPAGNYAKQVLEYLGLWDDLNAQAGKIVFTGNVREVLTYVATGNVDAGVVYATDAMIEPGVRVVSEAPEGSCERILYPACVIRGSKHEEEARAFLDYLSGETCAQILAGYGFTACDADAQEAQ